MEGYVFHSYGPERYVHHVVASVISLRRHDPDRPVALYAPAEHLAALERYGLDTLFAHLEVLPEAHRSIVGFKHHLHRFMPFAQSLFVDADMIWCRNPDALWDQFSGYSFTATGRERADVFFGASKGLGIVMDYLLDRRRRTLHRFGLTHLPRIQAGMIYAGDTDTTRRVCERAAAYLARRAETHFRSRLEEGGRTEESCEWSLAMAMSSFHLPVFPLYQSYNTPQLDFVEGYVQYDRDFEQVICRYYSDPFVHEFRGFPSPFFRRLFQRFLASLPGRGDFMDITPYVLHFGWLRYKTPFFEYAERVWERLTTRAAATAARPDAVVHAEAEAR